MLIQGAPRQVAVHAHLAQVCTLRLLGDPPGFGSAIGASRCPRYARALAHGSRLRRQRAPLLHELHLVVPQVAKDYFWRPAGTESDLPVYVFVADHVRVDVFGNRLALSQ